METKSRAHVIVSGSVQGVFFRMETKHAAERYGVFGWVKNRSDGTVEAVFEGEPENVGAIIDWCQSGPPYADVTDVTVKKEDYTGEFNGFDITY